MGGGGGQSPKIFFVVKIREGAGSPGALDPLLLLGAALGVLLKVLSASYQVSHTKLNKASKERQGLLARCPLRESRL